MSDIDRVIIVGGGPIGTLTGLRLARHGIPVTVLDKLDRPAEDHRAATLQPSTLDLFEPMGLHGRWLKIRTYFTLFPFYRRGMFRRQRAFMKSERAK